VHISVLHGILHRLDPEETRAGFNSLLAGRCHSVWLLRRYPRMFSGSYRTPGSGLDVTDRSSHMGAIKVSTMTQPSNARCHRAYKFAYDR
jgi:hypothetical protein